MEVFALSAVCQVEGSAFAGAPFQDHSLSTSSNQAPILNVAHQAVAAEAYARVQPVFQTWYKTVSE